MNKLLKLVGCAPGGGGATLPIFEMDQKLKMIKWFLQKKDQRGAEAFLEKVKILSRLLEVQRPFDPPCPSVSVGWWMGWSVCQKFLRGQEVTLCDAPIGALVIFKIRKQKYLKNIYAILVLLPNYYYYQ